MWREERKEEQWFDLGSSLPHARCAPSLRTVDGRRILRGPLGPGGKKGWLESPGLPASGHPFLCPAGAWRDGRLRSPSGGVPKKKKKISSDIYFFNFLDLI